MLQPGIRLIERSGALHFFDGRRVVSLRGDAAGRDAVRTATTAPAHADEPPAHHDARGLLTRLGLLLDDGPGFASADPPCPVAADYVSATTAGWVHPREAAERLAAQDVYVLDDAVLLNLLIASGLSAQHLPDVDAIAALDPQHCLVVASAERGCCLRPLDAVNATCVRAGMTWLPVGGFDGSCLRVGPLVVPGQSACLACAHRRLAANVTYSDLYADVADTACAPTPVALTAWAHAIAALLVLAWVGGRDVRLPGRVFTLGAEGLELRQGLAYRVPRCAVCAAPDYVTAAAPWEIARDH